MRHCTRNHIAQSTKFIAQSTELMENEWCFTKKDCRLAAFCLYVPVIAGYCRDAMHCVSTGDRKGAPLLLFHKFHRFIADFYKIDAGG